MHSLSSPLLRKCYLKNSPQEKDRWINLFQWRKVLTWAEFPRPRKEMAFSDTLKISVIHFFSQKRDRRSLVNRSKTETGVIVNLRQGNLTSMCDYVVVQYLFYENHPCTFKCHSPFSQDRDESNYDTLFNSRTRYKHLACQMIWNIQEMITERRWVILR